jgi:hypothetical protein
MIATPLTAEELAVIQAHLTPEELADLDRLLINPEDERARYRNDPVAFVREVLRVEEIAPYQEAIMRAVLKYKRVCVRSLHGAGKTTSAAWIILWFAAVHDECKVPTTASAWRQLSEFLWPEVHKWALRADWDRVGLRIRLSRELLQLRLNVSPTAFAFALSSVDEAKIEGAHSAYILYVFDEAKSIPAEIWDAAEGALSTDNCYAIAFSTPGDSIGRFYEIQSRRTGYEDWHVLHIGLEECIAAGRVTRVWAEQRKKAWGETSALYQRRVLGEFAEDESETVIRLSWIEQANRRWEERWARVWKLVNYGGHTQEAAEEVVWGPLTHLGVDPARMGRDKTGYAFRHGPAIKSVERTAKEELMPTTGKIVTATRETMTIVHLDTIGLGAGVYDRLAELWRLKEWRGDAQKLPVVSINVGNPTKWLDQTEQLRFQRVRDWLWWHMRELLEDPDSEIALPPDQQLTEDLLSARWDDTSAGFIAIEKKDKLREHLPNQRSPDTGEAVLLAFYPDDPPYTPMFALI